MRTFLVAGLAALALAAVGGSVQSAGAAEVLPNVSVGNAYSPEGYRHFPPPCSPSCLIAGKAFFTVRLTNKSSHTVSVHFRTCCGTARSVDPGRDYQPTSGTLVFQPGQTVKSVAVPIVLDFRAEPTETFQLVLESPVNAKAAGQAASIPHMGAHALGAAAYAAKAVGLAAPDRPEAIREEIRWQFDRMSEAARAALRQLPPENASGPLGPGLLASGLLGAIIRDLQASLADPHTG